MDVSAGEIQTVRKCIRTQQCSGKKKNRITDRGDTRSHAKYACQCDKTSYGLDYPLWESICR